MALFTFRVIVPESAKSAATLIALASDEIVMGYLSELGPIDPQVPIQTPDGNWDYRPAHSILDGFARIKAATDASDGRLSTAYLPMLQRLDPALLDLCQKAIDRSRELATAYLQAGQLKGDPNKALETAARLSGDASSSSGGGVPTRPYLSHGAVIDAVEAEGSLGLKVVSLAPDDPLWDAIWRLYVDLIVGLQRKGQRQLFESRSVSLSYS